MKNNGKKMITLMILLLLLVLPLVGSAASAGEKVVFTGPLACEYLDIDSAEFTLTKDGLLVTLVYRLHEGLSREQLANLEIISFYLMPDAETTEFPDGFVSGSVGRADGNHSEPTKSGVQYLDEGLWEPMESMPEVLYLRPFYKFMGEWGDALVLEVKDGEMRAADPAN